MHENPTRPPLEIIYIAGAGRSGSTLLGSILGGMERVAFIGETRLLWGQATKKTLCGCGRSLKSCPVWGPVLRHLKESGLVEDLRQTRSALKEAIRYRQVPQLLLNTQSHQSTFRRLRRAIGEMYRMVREITGARLIVDSSSHARYGLLLGNLPGLNLRTIQLVRDSRAVAYSNSRKKRRPEYQERKRYLRIRSVPRVSWIWSLRNMLARQVRRKAVRSSLLRYEDLTRAPGEAVRKLLDELDLKVKIPSLLEEGRVGFASSDMHTIAGNPVRFQSGAVRISADEEWRQKMPLRQKALATFMTGPLLASYGYNLW